MKQVKTILKSRYLVALSFLFIPAHLFAQGNPPTGSGGNPPTGSGGNTGSGTGFTNPLKYNTLAEFLSAFLSVVITIAYPLVVLAVIYTGFLFVKAQGNEEELKTAKRALVWTVVGAMLVLGAHAILLIVKDTLQSAGVQIN